MLLISLQSNALDLYTQTQHHFFFLLLTVKIFGTPKQSNLLLNSNFQLNH